MYKYTVCDKIFKPKSINLIFIPTLPMYYKNTKHILILYQKSVKIIHEGVISIHFFMLSV